MAVVSAENGTADIKTVHIAARKKLAAILALAANDIAVDFHRMDVAP